MRKSIIASILMLCIMCSANIVNASSGSSDFVASSLSVKPGDTFTVTLSAKCEDGINGIDATYSYEQDKLELVSANVANNNWVSMGTNGTIQVICNSTSKIKSDNIYILTFKVKDNISTNTTTKINTSNIKVDSDVTASNFSDAAKTLNINIITSNSNTLNESNGETNNANTSNESNGETNNTNTSNESNGETNNTKTPNKNNKETQNISKNKDNTISKQLLPKTGVNNYIWILFIGGILFVVAGYSLIKIKNKN